MIRFLASRPRGARASTPPRWTAGAASMAFGLAALAAALLPAPPAAAEFDTAARNAIALDAETGVVLMAKNPDQPIPPASMSKLMTALMVFEALDQGRLKLTDQAPVSQAAFQKEGSTMFLNLTDRPTIADLLRGVIVQSGNDASIVLAEALAGSERAFADRMTKRARELGMRDSVFRNATGLPDPEHRMTVRDLATLALEIVRAHPDRYQLYAETSFTWAGVEQRNRNPLLYLNVGGDGLKTGHTEEAGYGIVGSATRDGRRVIVVLAGLDSQRARAREIERAVSWALREFRTVTVAEAGEIIGEAEVWIGAADRVPLTVAEDLRVTLPWFDAEETTATVEYQGPVPAPIAAGDRIGTLRIEAPGLSPAETPLIAARDVDEGGYLSRLSGGLGLGMRWLIAKLWP